MSRRELKQAAKDQLRGNWIWAICLSFFAWFIIYLVNDIESFISTGHDTTYYAYYQISNGVKEPMVEPIGGLIGFIISVLAGVLLWGVTYTILQFRDNGDKPNIFSGIFSAYRGSRFTSSFLTFLCQYIFTILWTLLLIIPGIIKGFSYAMTPYIMKDLYDAGK